MTFQDFLNLYDANIHREGSKELREWLVGSSLANDPASTRFHGNYAGGLVDHSIYVYYQFRNLLSAYGLRIDIPSEESIAIMSLLHDVCKIGKYTIEQRNVKENGVWVQKPFYKHDDQLCIGYHGPQSVFLIQRFMKLTDEEIAAIANHMGAYDRSPGDFELGKVYEKYPVAFLLHTADNAATIFDEHTV